jgi:Bax protein
MNLTRTDSFFLGLLATAAVAALFVPRADSTQMIAVATPVSVEVESPAAATKPAQSEASNILPRKNQVATSSLPDFAAIRDVRKKKQEFFDFMLPMIRESNRNIRQDRRFLLTLRDDLRTVMSLNDKELSRFDRLSQRYRVKPADSLLDQVNALLVKVDVVPESLVLAQSANESGWGTSRFARQANNMFGVWCWSPGCGLKPLQRTEGLTHEVARYATVQDSVNAYIHTINTNPAYADLRDIRAAHRAGDEIMSGLALAEGLIRYSERGMDYVREIQQMIRVNNLHEYNFS